MRNSKNHLLRKIYHADEIDVRKLLSTIKRKHGDHRDFYELAGLLQEGYVGFTGPILDTAWDMAKQFQCYSQGEGSQKYMNITMLPHNDFGDSKLYIASKGINYFDELSEKRKDRALGLILSIIAGCSVGWVSATFFNNSADGKLAAVSAQLEAGNKTLSELVTNIKSEELGKIHKAISESGAEIASSCSEIANRIDLHAKSLTNRCSGVAKAAN